MTPDLSPQVICGSPGSLAPKLLVAHGGFGPGMTAALEPRRSPLTVHEEGKVLVDLAIAVGGDCLADMGQVRLDADDVRHGGVRPRRLSRLKAELLI